MRANWEQTWLAVAETISKRSRCVNRQVGAVIVDENNRPIAVGYNGPPANMAVKDQCGDFCPRGGSKYRPGSYENCVSVHAEANALLFADRRLFTQATIYVTNPCCWDCAKLIANSGITKVVMQKSAADNHATWDHVMNLFDKCSISAVIIERENNDI